MAAGSISIDVLANTTKLVAGMKKAENIVSRTAKNMARSMMAFGSVFATGALVSGINSSIKSLDALNKTASKLGTTTEELSSLGYAAERSGVSIKTFEMAMQRMTRRVAEAAAGTGEAKNALKELGVEAENLNDLSLEDKMAVLADSFQGVESESDKLRLAFKLFDSEGAALVNMLNGGSEALKDMQRESDALGSTIGKSLADEASKSADAILNFNSAFTAMTNNILSSFLPALNSAFFAIMDFFDIPRQKGLQELEEQAASLRRKIEHLDKTSQRGGRWSNLSKNIPKVKEELSAVEIQIEKVKKSLEGQSTENFFGTVSGDANVFRDALEKLKTSLDPVGTQIKQYYESMAILDEALSKTAISQSEYNLMVSNLNNSMPKVTTDTKKFTKELANTNKAAQAVNTTFASGMTSAFREAMDGATSFGEMFENIGKDIVAQLIHILVVQQAVNALMYGSTMKAGSGEGLASVFGLNGGLATGGTVNSAGTYVVGEKGPEILNLPAGANVTPNGASTSSAAPVVNVYNNTSSEISTDVNADGQYEIFINRMSNDVVKGIGPFGPSIENRYKISKR